MYAVSTTLLINAFAGILAPFRRLRAPRAARRATNAPAKAPVMDAATYAAMVAEAERIAAPYRRHVAEQLDALQQPDADAPGGDFPEVEALLARAGLITR